MTEAGPCYPQGTAGQEDNENTGAQQTCAQNSSSQPQSRCHSLGQTIL